MGKKHDIPVKCCRCRNQHQKSERNDVPVKGSMIATQSVCPRCGCHSYFDMRPFSAWCFATGLIEFGDPGSEPEGAIVIASGPKTELKYRVGVFARHGYEHGVLLVPGVPEVDDQSLKGDALEKWLLWCAKGNGKKSSHGVVFHAFPLAAVQEGA